jgi:hypothetical protein
MAAPTRKLTVVDRTFIEVRLKDGSAFIASRTPT